MENENNENGDDENKNDENKNDGDDENKNGDNGDENEMYQCFDETSEYKWWVIKLDLTTPVKFQEKVKFSLSLSTLNTLRLFISLHY